MWYPVEEEVSFMFQDWIRATTLNPPSMKQSIAKERLRDKLMRFVIVCRPLILWEMQKQWTMLAITSKTGKKFNLRN